MKTLRILILTVMISLFSIGLFSTSALAISNPDTIDIHHVWVYQNCKETDDQLYIVNFTIDYASNPTERASEAFVLRLMNGTSELANALPYAYEDDGYAMGVVAFYFSASEAPTWEGSYKVELFGNPLLTWSGDVPYTSFVTFDVWQDNDISVTQTLIASRVLWLAELLTIDWDASYDLFDIYASGEYLSSYGVEYFPKVIPYLSELAPGAFAGKTLSPEVEDRDYDQSYSDELAGDIADTPLDMTSLGTAFGTDRGTITAFVYYLAVFIILGFITYKLQTHKPLMIMLVPCIVLGAFLGVPIIITLVIGFIALIALAYVLFYSGATA